MKKRHFLKTSAAFIGTLTLSSCLPSQANEQTPSTTNQSAHSKGTFEINKTDAEWRALLSPEAYAVLREEGTEAPYSSPLNDITTAGTYSCAGCELPVYTSDTKFDSGTGWPSFYAPIENAVATSVDRSFLMTRTEVHCRRCGGHLGHVFDDGPAPTGKRYCMNGVAMSFTAAT